MATKESTLGDREFESYVDTGNEVSSEVTLSATPGTVTAITIPNQYKGFRLYPRTNHVRFSVNRSAAAVGTVATGNQAATIGNFDTGGVAKAEAWETRLLPAVGTNNSTSQSRVLYLRSITASVVVDVELF